MEKQVTGIRKRQQIKKANNTMFLWVVAAAAALTVCLVTSVFLVKQLMFNQRIIDAKDTTKKTLVKNKETFGSIKTEVNKLTANSQLNSLKVEQTDTTLQVIIDALPTADDRAALATSLQQVVLAPSGASIESLSVTDGAVAVEDETAADTTGAPVAVNFTIVLNGNYEQIGRAIADMERSIRPITVEQVQIEGTGTVLRASIYAKTYYLSAKSVELKTETIKP